MCVNVIVNCYINHFFLKKFDLLIVQIKWSNNEARSTIMNFDKNNFMPENDDYYNIFAYARFIKAFKFLAYSNEVGETIRHTFPKLVVPAYCLSFGYVFSDMYHHCYPMYHDKGWCDETKMTIRNRAIWHSTASLIFPTLAIGGAIKGSKYLMIKTGVKVHYIRWALPIIGIGLIPFVIKPIDNFTEKYIMPHFENQS